MTENQKHISGGFEIDELKRQMARRRKLRRAASQRRLKLAASVAAISMFASHAANATTNVADTYTATAGGALDTAGNWSGGEPAVGNDAIINATTTSGQANFTLNASAETFGSLNDTNTAAVSITGSKALTLGGGGSANGFSGNSGDLLYVASGSTLNYSGTGGIVLGQSGNFDVAGTSTINPTISDGGAGYGITKTGVGTLALSGASSYSGATSLSGGTLTLTGSLSSTTFNLGGGTFNYSTTGTNTQSFTTTNLNGFAYVNNTVSTDTLKLGNINRTSPGTVNFTTTTGHITTTTGLDDSGSGNILGPWATIGTGTSLDYAVPNGGGSAITSYTSGTALTTAGGGTANVTNFTLANASITLAASSPVTADTLQVLNTDASGITLANGGNNITLNGILNSGGSGGSLTVSGTGSLIAGANKEIDITNNNQSTTISSVIANGSGASSLVFTGLAGGQLTLTGNNSFSNGLYINSGQVTIGSGANANALGTGSVYLGTGGSANATLYYTQGSNLTLSNPINTVSNATGVLEIYNNSGNATFSGLATLASNLVLVNSNNNAGNGITLSGGIAGTGNVTVTNTSVTPVNITAGTVNFTGTITNSSTSTGGLSIAANLTGAESLVQNSGLSATVLSGTNTNTGPTTVTLGALDYQVVSALTTNATTTVANAGTLILGVGSSPTYFTSGNVDSLFSNTLANITMGSTSGVGIDTTEGNFTYATNQTGERNFSKAGSNTLTLSGTDIFGAGTVMGTGTLLLTGQESFLGGITAFSGTTLQIGSGSPGADDSLGLTPSIVNNAAVVFDDFAAENYAGIITGSGTLTKMGAGTQTLSSANFFTGNTNVTAGTLDLANSQALQNSALQTGGTDLTFDQSVTSHSFVIGGLNGGTNLALTDNGGNAVALTLHPTNSGLTYDGVISGAGSSLTMAGANHTQILGGLNTYTGNTVVTLGTLELDFTQTNAPTSNIVYNGVSAGAETSAESLTMGGVGAATNSDGFPGANLLLNGKVSTTNTQTFYGLTLNPGASNITITPGTSGNVQLSFTNGLTHNAGGVINFADTQSGTNYISVGNGSTTGTLNDATGIIGGYATVNGTSYATVNGSGQVVPYTYGTTVGTSGAILDSGSASAETNVELTGGAGTETLSGTTNSATNINTLTNAGTGAQIVNIASGQTLRLGVNGGILENTTTNQSLTIGTSANTGILTAGGNSYGTAGEISIVGRSNGTITLNSTIANNNASTGAGNSTSGGAVTLTIGSTQTGGTRNVVIYGNNTYSGGTYVDGSEVNVQSATAFGTGQVTVLPGAQLFLDVGGTYANQFNIAGVGANEGGYASAIRFVSGGITLSNTINLEADSAVQLQQNGSLTGNLTGTGNLNLFASSGATVTLGSGSSTDTITGNLCLNGFAPGVPYAQGVGFTVKLGSNMLPNGTSSGNVIINGGSTTAGTNVTLDLNGNSVSTNGLVSTGPYVASSTITNSGASANLTIGDNNANAVFGGSITDGGSGKTLSIIKAGTGTQIFSGANSYTGGTTINAGTLLTDSNDTVNGATGSGLVTVNNGGTLAGSGVVKGGITVNSGGMLTAGTGVASATVAAVPGILNANAGTTTLASGSNLDIKVNNVTGSVGTNWDEILMSALNVSSGGVNINLYGLTAGNLVGATPNFNSTSSFTLQIADISGVNPTTLAGDISSSDFTLNTSNFTASNTPSVGATFTLSALADAGSGSFLDLTYNATPEPGTAMLLLTGALPMLSNRRRRRNASSVHDPRGAGG